MTFPDTGKFRGIAIISFKVRAKTSIFSFILLVFCNFKSNLETLFVLPYMVGLIAMFQQAILAIHYRSISIGSYIIFEFILTYS